MLSNPANADFKFTPEAVEKFLVDWMKECDFPEGTCVLKMKEEVDAASDDIATGALDIADYLKDPEQHQSFGLNLLMKNRSELLLSDTAITEIFAAICRVALIGTKAEVEVPDGAEQAAIDQINTENDAIRVYNDSLNKLKNKISVQVPNTKYEKPEEAETWHYPENFDNYEFWEEKCYIRLQNYKDPEGVVVEDLKPLDKKAQMAKEAERAKMMK